MTWDDLLIQDLTPDSTRLWLAPWSGVVSGSLSPIFLNKFGSWFFQRRDGRVETLDVFTGAVAEVAGSFDAFQARVNDLKWQETYLISKTVFALLQRGVVPGPGQCYAVAPHPAHGGRHPAALDGPDLRCVMVMDVVVWQSVCSQALGYAG